MSFHDPNQHRNRGGVPVGFVAELDAIEAASVVYLRLWCDGPQSRSLIEADFVEGLGQASGKAAFKSFEDLTRMCIRHGRRPLMHHAVQCKYVGSDEACFANFIASAVEGDREDALMIATLLARPDVAPIIASLATQFGLALKRMQLKAPRDSTGDLTAPANQSNRLH